MCFMLYSHLMNTILFGTAGIPLSTPGSTTVDGIHHLHTLGLDAMEIEFVRQVYLTQNTALAVGSAAREYNIHLSAHAPYYLNLNALEPEKIAKSKAILFRAAYIGSFAGAYNVVFHPGYYLKRIIAENDLVAIHYNFRPEKNEEGYAIVDIFRVEKGKLVEHWDVCQEMPEKSLNDSPMF